MVTGTVLALVTTGVIVVSGSRSVHPSEAVAAETKGTIPASTNGKINTKKVPDFISTWGRDGKIVGYIPRAYLFPEPNQPVKVGGIAPVYASNLKTLVGYMYPGVGYVALGESPASQPCMPAITMGRTANGQTTTGTIPCPSTVETVPNIVGLSLPTAMGQLSAEGLQASISYVHSSTVPGGHVISVMPIPGTEVPARSMLTVVSSLSPGQTVTTAPAYPFAVEIPNIVGLSLPTAIGQLRNKVTANISYVHSASVTAGHVISVTPGPGARVAEGQDVNVVSSLGPG